MIPWSLLETAQVPGGGGEIRLMQRGADFSIMLGETELMGSRLSGSEEALATITCERIRVRERPRVLIGGLGMGFTLRAALGALGTEAQITVAELVPAVVAWARGPMAAMFGNSLTDARVSLREADVGQLIERASSSYDAILLDVDNGPKALTRDANDRLYNLQGLSAAHTALRPGGVLAVWSSGPDTGFSRRLRAIGFGVEEVRARANGARGGARHHIWIATRANRNPPNGRGAMTKHGR
jgi:spermidine synthase